MRSINGRLTRLEKHIGADRSRFWCEETETHVIFHGPGPDVVLPAKEPGRWLRSLSDEQLFSTNIGEVN